MMERQKLPGYATRPPVSRPQSENESLVFQAPYSQRPCRALYQRVPKRRISSVTRDLKRILSGEAVWSSSAPEGESARLHTTSIIAHRTTKESYTSYRPSGTQLFNLDEPCSPIRWAQRDRPEPLLWLASRPDGNESSRLLATTFPRR